LILGLLLDDVKSFGLHSALKPFAQSDISLLKRMLNRLGLTNGAWVCYEKVLLDMLEYGQKAELQSLYQRGTEFLASEYLPSKLLQHQFV
jgi:DNA topoisomerase VI subunit A